MSASDSILNCDQRNALAALSISHPNHCMGKFFLTREAWCQDAMTRAAQLELAGRSPLRILDVGCGVPYFLAAARHLGHAVTGLDVPDNVMQESARIMGLTYTEHVIREDTELPRLAVYDLVTMFGVNLRRADGQWWQWEDWRSLVKELLEHVDAGGRLVIQPNTGPHCSELLLDESRWQAEQLPAAVRVDGIWLLFTKEDVAESIEWAKAHCGME